MKVERAPEPWARLHRLSAASILRAERASLAEARAAIEAAVGAAFTTEHDRARAVREVRETARRIERAATAAFRATRERARSAALERLARELREVERHLDLAGFEASLFAPSPTEVPEDEARAEQAGRSYSAAWSAAALAAVLRWDDRGGGGLSLRTRVDVATRRQDHRVRRVVATETASAHAAAKDEGVGYVAEENAGAPWLPLLVKIWNAVLDRRTCAYCRGRDGDVVPAGLSFSGGDVPGEVHPNCRCDVSLMLLPVPAGTARRAGGEYVGTDEEGSAA